MRCLNAGKSDVKFLAEFCAGRSQCLGRTAMKISVAPRSFLLAAFVLPPPYLSTVLTRSYEPGDWRVLENPRLVLRQTRYTRADATYGDDKNHLREHHSLQPTVPLSRHNQARKLGQHNGPNLCGPGAQGCHALAADGRPLLSWRVQDEALHALAGSLPPQLDAFLGKQDSNDVAPGDQVCSKSFGRSGNPSAL